MIRSIAALAFLTGFAIIAATTWTGAPAADPGGAYFQPGYVEQQLILNWGRSNVSCGGRTDGGHGMTQWPPGYVARYQLFRCLSTSHGAENWHTTPGGGLRKDTSWPA